MPLLLPKKPFLLRIKLRFVSINSSVNDAKKLPCMTLSSLRSTTSFGAKLYLAI